MYLSPYEVQSMISRFVDVSRKPYVPEPVPGHGVRAI